MYIEQIYTKCLSEAAYYIESNGEVAIIDPLREVDPYIAKAKERRATIKYVFETHFHADFVSGHIDLANKTGATIVFGPNANSAYAIHQGYDGEVFAIGDLTLTLLHTPGHTMESSCFLLKDSCAAPKAVFTGDTLFVGDVGRPDLAVKSDEVTQEDLASMLYDSLRNKLMILPDDVVVYPAHGAGSSCGKNIGSETSSTIGQQKATNYALQSISKEAFIKEVTEGLLAPPPYFFKDVMMNKQGYESLDVVLTNSTQALEAATLSKKVQEGAVLLDIRNPSVFAQEHIKGAINIGLNGQFAPWVGTIVPPNSTIVLVADEEKVEEAIIRLARIGYDDVIGFLAGGMPAWEGETASVEDVSPKTATTIINNHTHQILDVRKPAEVEAAHVLGSKHIRLQELSDRLSELDKEHPIAIYCAGGYRSMIAASILKKQEFKHITNIQGGFNKLKNQALKISEGENCTKR